MKNRYHIIVACFYIAVLIFFLYALTPSLYFHFSAKDLPTGIYILIGAVISLVCATRIIGFGKITYTQTSPSRFTQLVLYAFFFGLVEEILFRGLIQGFFQTLPLGETFAIASAAAIYGLAHAFNDAQGYAFRGLNWKLVAMTFIAGTWLGVAYATTGSLVVPIAIHSILIMLLKLLVQEAR